MPWATRKERRANGTARVILCSLGKKGPLSEREVNGELRR